MTHPRQYTDCVGAAPVTPGRRSGLQENCMSDPGTLRQTPRRRSEPMRRLLLSLTLLTLSA
ncbi:hypothetical protein GCM10008019_09920 [Deinococcus soli (ex Cha et al. 2016)]|nr:hypothetical protein GCM10008019_09920 [Deinococcus soli (ex Cha et al. 2016)]